MTSGRTLLVCTEAPSYLDAARRERFERLRARLSGAAGGECSLVHYPDVTSFRGFGAVVVSGSDAPWQKHPPGAFRPLERAIRSAGEPLLGICAGMQILTWAFGGSVEPLRPPGPPAETGFRPVEVLVGDDPLVRGIGPTADFYESHTYEVTRVPEGFETIAAGARCAHEAIRAVDAPVWGVQFHPECADADHPAGERLLANFFAAARASS